MCKKNSMENRQTDLMVYRVKNNKQKVCRWLALVPHALPQMEAVYTQPSSIIFGLPEVHSHSYYYDQHWNVKFNIQSPYYTAMTK